jgi:drug/metabolite transporter (DMT)-like permease
MSSQNLPQSIKAGAIYTILTMAGAATLGALVKWASGGFSSEFLTSVRFFSGFMIMILIYALGRHGSLKTKSLGIQFGVAASWVLGILIYYVSIRFIPLMDATLLLNTAAIFGPILAKFFDGKREPKLVWLGTAIGFAGIVVVLRPGPVLFENPMSLIGIMAGFFAGLRLLFNSKLKEDSAQCTTFYSLLLGSGICLLILLSVGVPIRAPHWETMMFSPRDSMSPWFVDSSLILVVVIFGLLSMLMPWLTAKGLSYASVGQIAPFRYTAVIFAGLLDWAIWDVVPSWPSYVGFALVLGGAMLILKGKRT